MKRIVSMATVVTALWVAAVVAWVDAWPAVAQGHQAVVVYAPPTVEIAPGVDMDQAEVTAVVFGIVNDPRGWRTDLDEWTVRIVPPGTRGAGGLGALIGIAIADEHLALVTADGWTTLGPKFAAVGGTLDDQRTWIVLHELGHLLGHDHTGCPGAGPAPVMRAADYELGGCDLNVWPNPQSAKTHSSRSRN